MCGGNRAGPARPAAPLVARLRADATYSDLFAASFPEDGDPVTVGKVAKAIAAFQRTLISGRSPYDRYVQQHDDALDESAKRGMALFFSE